MLSRFSFVRFCVTPWTVGRQAPLPWDSPGKNTGMGCHALLQGIFPAQGWNLHLFCLLRWRLALLEKPLLGLAPSFICNLSSLLPRDTRFQLLCIKIWAFWSGE